MVDDFLDGGVWHDVRRVVGQDFANKIVDGVFGRGVEIEAIIYVNRFIEGGAYQGDAHVGGGDDLL